MHQTNRIYNLIDCTQTGSSKLISGFCVVCLFVCLFAGMLVYVRWPEPQELPLFNLCCYCSMCRHAGSDRRGPHIVEPRSVCYWCVAMGWLINTQLLVYRVIVVINFVQYSATSTTHLGSRIGRSMKCHSLPGTQLNFSLKMIRIVEFGDFFVFVREWYVYRKQGICRLQINDLVSRLKKYRTVK